MFLSTWCKEDILFCFKTKRMSLSDCFPLKIGDLIFFHDEDENCEPGMILAIYDNTIMILFPTD